MTHATNFKKHYEDWIDRFGTTYTKTRETPTTDPMGYRTGKTTTTATISGDFQMITDETELRELGQEGVASAKFYGRADDDIQEGDMITVGGYYWQFRRRIDDDSLQGVDVASVWIVIKIDG